MSLVRIAQRHARWFVVLSSIGAGFLATRRVGPATAGALAVLLVAVLAIRSSVRRAGPWMVQLAILSLAAHLLVGWGQTILSASLGEATDSEAYFHAGEAIATHSPNHPYRPKVPGTGTIQLASATAYRLGLNTYLSQIVAFTALAWCGSLLMALATLRFLRYPDQTRPRRRIRMIIWALVLLPSSLFWPAAIGKDAVMALAIGLTLFGFATRLSDRRVGRLAVVLGTALGLIVRPHVQVLLMVAALVGLVLSRTLSPSGSKDERRQQGIVIPLLIVSATLPIALAYAQSFAPDDESSTFQAVESRTFRGESAFRPPIESPLAPILIPVTVLLRPFPFETHSIVFTALALETLAVTLVLLWVLRGRASVLFRAFRRDFLVSTVVTYTFAFCWAFSSVSNFGILTRQRLQVTGPILVMVAYLLAQPRTGNDRPALSRAPGSQGHPPVSHTTGWAPAGRP